MRPEARIALLNAASGGAARLAAFLKHCEPDASQTDPISDAVRQACRALEQAHFYLSFAARELHDRTEAVETGKVSS